MKNNFLNLFFVIVCFLLFGNKANAVTSEGYYIKKNNDTVYATFNTTPFSKFLIKNTLVDLQRSITVIKQDDTKEKLLPQDILSFTLFVKNAKNDLITDTFTFDAKSYKIFKKDHYDFMRRIVKGKLSLYVYYYISNMPTQKLNGQGFERSNEFMENYIIVDADDKLYNTSLINFTKELTKVFSDCASVVKKIENKTYNKNNCVEMVNEYNSCGY